MRKFSSKAAGFVCIAAISVTLVGCGQVRALRARLAIKDAHSRYQAQDYKAAIEKYEETIALAPEAVAIEPNLAPAYFFLANSYDNMYLPSKQGDPANDAMLTKAIDNYKKAAQIQNNPQLKTLALQYLVAAYGPDKLNDPSQAEPLVQQMIQMDPKEPLNYFALAKIYEDSGDYDNAEATLIRARDAKPSDAAVYTTLATYYNRQGEFEKTIQALEARTKQEPNNPEAFYTIATYYWDKAYRDFRLPTASKIKYVQSGVEAVDKAIALNNNYMEAIVYKNLLLRLMANLEKNPARQQALLKEADQLRNRADELQKRKTAGLGS
jgi:tetratricopeptide (TPR) repeat protein